MERDTKTNIDDSITKLIIDLNNNYVHWDKFRDMQLPDPDYRIAIWTKATAEREQGFTRTLTIGGLSVKWWLSNNMEFILHQLDIGLAGGRGMESLLEAKHIHRHKTTALLEESISSAQLSGALVSKKAAKEMLLKKRSPQNVNEQICINIYRTLQLGFSKKDQVLDEPFFLQLHQVLTKDTIKLKGIGNYRTNNKTDMSCVDASAGYKPSDTKQIRECMSAIFEFYNNDAAPFFIHPLIKACIIHYLIVCIRPFKDANGRMARLLAQMYLLKKGYWIAGFIAVSNVISKFKLNYHKSIVQSQTDENNIGYFIHFYIQAVQMAYRSLRDFVGRISKEKKENSLYKIPGYNERQTAVLQWIKEDAAKMVTIRELRSVYGVSKETARTDLNGLVEKGWIRYFNINKKAYAFVKADGFDGLIKQVS
ncbi:MAG: Fic family protein [Niabella sp.]